MTHRSWKACQYKSISLSTPYGREESSAPRGHIARSVLSILTDNGNEFQSFMTEDEHSRQQPFSGIRHLGYVQIKLDWTRTWQLSIRRSQATVGVELSPHMVTHEPAMLAQGCSTLLSPPFPPMYRFLVHFTTFIHLYRATAQRKLMPLSWRRKYSRIGYLQSF